MTARMNISLPDELKERMDTTESPVNWSGVAARAFRDKLDELRFESERRSIAEVVERLRASRLEHCGAPEPEADRYGEGLALGMRWASEAASWPELEALDEALGRSTAEDWDAPEGLVARAEALLEAGAPGPFWHTWFGETPPGARQVHGFCDGALAIFEQVRRQLEAE